MDAPRLARHRRRIVDRLTSPGGGSVHAPEVVDLEVAQTLRRLEREGRFAPSAGHAFLDVHRLFPIRRHGHERYLARIWDGRPKSGRVSRAAAA